MKILVLFLALFGLISSAGASLGDDLQVSSLMQKKQHHEVIRILQAKLDRKEPISSFQLFLLAGAYSEIRNYGKIIVTADLLEKQIKTGDSKYFSGDLTAYPLILRALAALDLGDYDKAVTEATAARTCLGQDRQGNMFYRAQSIQIADILGVAFSLMGNSRESDGCLAQLEDVSVSGTNLGPEKHLAIARIHMAARRFDKALAAILNPESQVPAALTEHYDPTFQELPKFFILTKCRYETGMISEARAGYDQLLRHPQISEIGGLHWLILLDRAKIARMDGDDGLAEKLLREAIEIIERQRSSIPSETGRIGYVGDKQSPYRELISILVVQGRPVDAFEFSERAKGRALVDLLADQHLRCASPSVAQDALEQLAKAEKDLGIIAQPGSAASSTSRGIALEIKQKIASQAPEMASLVTVNRIAARDIQDRLAPDETLLEYYAAEESWFVFVVRRTTVIAQRLAAPNIMRDVQDLRAALSIPVLSRYAPLSRKVYDSLFAPVANDVPSGRLIIVPHGPLHYLPFGALSSGEQALIDQYNIRILPSAGVLKYLRPAEKRNLRSALILGNPDLGDPKHDLKFAQEEALAISKVLSRPTLLMRHEAKASVVKKEGKAFDILHFAAHGRFDPANPLNSALLLAREAGDDGLLRARDLYTLNLNAELVTLSACETGLAAISKGDDIVGFTRGFLYAGARSIVSSLWSVDDLATRDLMIAFYQRLPLMGKDKALKQAQLEVRKRQKHPFYWAAFQLIGLAN